MKPALDGLLLLDLSTGIAGPYAAMLLTDMGADTIKVEPGEGDPARDLPGFLLWNRGKKSLTLDLDTEEGRGIIHRLSEKADIVVESFTPGEAKRLGMEYETLSSINPRLIYCAIPPFGEHGPLKEKPGNEGVVAALAGIMGGQGGFGQPPVFVTLPLASYGAAFLTAYGAAAALYVREVTGIGQKVEVSLLAGAIAMQSSSFIRAGTSAPIASRRNTQQGLIPVYRIYRCQDDWLFVGCGNNTFWNKLCIALEREDLAADPRFAGAPWAMPKEEDRDALTDILANILHEKPREYWLKLFEAGDVPCAPVSRREEFMEDPQVRHNEMIITIDDPQVGKTRQMGIPVTLVESPGRIQGPAPGLGEHTHAVLAEAGFSESEIDMFKIRGVV